MKTIMITMACWVALAPAALAQDAADGDNLTRYEFEDDLVGGDRPNPNGEILNVRRRGQRESLIRVREHFIDHLLESVQRL
jgi:hypothetical protein